MAVAESIRTVAAPLYGGEAAAGLAEQVRTAASRGAEVLLDGGRVVGVGLYSRDGEAGRIDFMHVLPGHLSKPAYVMLVGAVVNRLRQRGVSEIVCEGGTLQGAALGDALAQCGFRMYERAILGRPTSEQPPALPAGHAFVPLSGLKREEIAEVVYDAFAGGPDAVFDYHFRSVANARALCDALFAGRHGHYMDEFSTGLQTADGLAGVVFTTVLAPGRGFVLLVAVSPRWRGNRLGEIMMRETIARLGAEGYTRVELAVTVANLPAWHLYRRLGFRVVRFFPVYHARY